MFAFLTVGLTYMVLEYCVGGLQEMLDKAPHNKFPLWQAHRSVPDTYTLHVLIAIMINLINSCVHFVFLDAFSPFFD